MSTESSTKDGTDDKPPPMPEHQQGDFWHDPGEIMDESPSAGAGIADAAYQIKDAADKNDATAIGISSAGLALDTLGLVLDPLGSVLSAGVGWLLEHVTPFRVPLDMMMGDPEGVKAAAEAISKVQDVLDYEASEHENALKALKDSWSGEGADTFIKDMQAVAEQIRGLGEYVKSAAKNMEIAGALIGAFRGIVRDIIAGVLGGLIAGAIAAAAAMPFTFGASIGIFLGVAGTTIAVTMAKIATKIAELTEKLLGLVKSLKDLAQAGDKFNSQVDNAANSTPAPKPGGGGTPGSGPKPDKDTGKAPDLNGSGKDDGGKPDGTPESKPTSTKPDDKPDEKPDGTKPDDEPEPKPDDAKQDDRPSTTHTSHEPWPDKVQRYAKDQLNKKIDEYALGNPGFKPEHRQEILNKFDNFLSIPKNQASSLIGEKWTERYEGIVKTLTDPSYGNRGLVGKSIVETIKAAPAIKDADTNGSDDSEE